MYSIGIDIGYSSVKVSMIDSERNVIKSCYRLHRGSIAESLLELLEDVNSEFGYKRIAYGAFIGIGSKQLAQQCCGKSVEEVPALVEAGLMNQKSIGSIINIGGQSSMFITDIDCDNKSNIKIAMNSTCAAGTGGFLEEQISRMNLALDDYTFYTKRATSIPRIAGRCSVFAKTDITHHQQEGVGIKDILLGLCYAVIRNFKGTVMKRLPIKKPVYFCGGGAFNGGLLIALKDLLKLSDGELIVSDNPVNDSALGAALIAQNNGYSFDLESLISKLKNNQLYNSDDFSIMKPLNLNIMNDALGKHLCSDYIENQGHYLGIDVGSTSTNLVLMNDKRQIVAFEYIRTYGKPVETIQRGLKRLKEKVGSDIKILGTGITGSGRYLIAELLKIDVVRDEITSQARAAYEIDPEVDTIFEIGGQDSKFISIKNGEVIDFQMNKICAAGTGSFIEEQSKKFDIPIEEFSDFALSGTHPVDLGDRCTVFIETSIASCLSKGISVTDITAGLCYSIVKNYLNRVVGKKNIGKKILFQGGVAYNQGVVNAFRSIVHSQIVVPPFFSVTGAYGVAIIASETMEKKASTFIGFDGRLETTKHDEETSVTTSFDKTINEIIFDDYESGFDENRETVGIPLALFTYGMFPMFHSFFKSLGFNVQLSDISNEQTIADAQEFAMEETCFPMKLLNGHIADLMKKKVDYILIPDLFTADHPESKTRMNYGCVYMQTAFKMIRQSMDLESQNIQLLTPTIAPNIGSDFMEKSFLKLGEKLNRDADDIRNALTLSFEATKKFKRKLKDNAENRIKTIDANKITFVIVSKLYGVLDPVLNVGVAGKLEKMGYDVLSFTDLMQSDIFSDYNNMYWPFSQHIIGAAKYIYDMPNMYAVFLTHHGCGPDSVVSHYFKNEMKDKPYLNIEVDEHSSDVGIITRIEAFVNSVHQNSKLKETVYLQHMYPYSDLLQYALKNEKRHVKVLPMTSQTSLQTGRAYTDVQEYLSLTSLIGDVLTHIKKHPSKKSSYMVYRTEGAEVDGQYSKMLQSIIDKEGIEDVNIIEPFLEDVIDMNRDIFESIALCLLAGDIIHMADLEDRESYLNEVIELLKSNSLNLIALEHLADRIDYAHYKINYQNQLTVIGEPQVVFNSYLNKHMLNDLEKKRYKIVYHSMSETMWLYWHDALSMKKGDFNKAYENLDHFKRMIQKIATKFTSASSFSDLDGLVDLAQESMGYYSGAFGRYRGAKLCSEMKGIDGILTLNSMYENTGIALNVMAGGFHRKNNKPVLNLAFDGNNNDNDQVKLSSFLYYLKEEK